MSTIGSVSSSQTNYEVNAKAYGPVVAGAVGIVEAAGDAVSAVCSFSAESLGKLSDAAESEMHSIGDAIGEAIDSAEAGVTRLYTDVANLTKEGIQAIGDAASSVADGISSAAGNVGVAATVSVAAGKA